MPAPARRAAAPAVQKVNIGSLSSYSGGFTLPEGYYALEFNAKMHQAEDKQGNKKGNPRLGVMVTAYPITPTGEGNGEPVEQFFSMGSKAHESFAPDPDTGKGLVAVAGGSGAQLNNMTNWFLFLKSLYDCGMPDGVFENDFTAIDGVWVHTQNVPEPEGRKGFAAATGEAAEERRSGLVPIVSEILDGGKPWEDGGGIPAETTPAPAPKAGAKKPAAAPARAAAPATRRPAAPPPPPPAEEAGDDEEVATAAINAVGSVIEKNPNGMTKVKLRVDTFKAIADEAMKQAVTETYFSSDDALNGLLGQLGYTVKGVNIVVA